MKLPKGARLIIGIMKPRLEAPRRRDRKWGLKKWKRAGRREARRGRDRKWGHKKWKHAARREASQGSAPISRVMDDTYSKRASASEEVLKNKLAAFERACRVGF